MSEFARQIGDVQVVVRCIDALEQQAHWLLQTINQIHKGGGKLAHGSKVQVGWSVLTLQQQGKILVVCEPDYSKNPFADLVGSVNQTLTVLAQQRDLLRKLNLEGAPCLYSDKVVLAKGCLTAERLYMERTATSSAHDSGWYIDRVADGEEIEQPEEYEAIYLYQLLQLRPVLLSATALPVGYLVVVDGDQLEAVVNEEGVDLFAN